MKIEVCIWEHDEYIIAIRPDDAPVSSDQPIGYTLSRPDALKVREWLETALPEIQRATQAELAALRQQRDELLACAKGSRILIGEFAEFLKEDSPIPMLEALDQAIARAGGK